ncbi:FecR family protein [Butyricimonas faecihominis]|uniref:FecR family protein n=1 Tax=Butyricimonas faecihominis TaxID=1472416 RepID=UPI00266ECA43|nr:FecR domain-containing protein [Butyricimonas faecihominis]
MEKENQNNQEQWLKAFVDREEDFDYEAFCEMMRSLDNEDLREEFERVRRLTALVANKAKMWKQVQSRMNKNSRYQVKRYLKYAAIIVAFVLAGGTWWMVKENPEEIISVELSETSMLSPGTPKAYILFSSGQRMDLTTTEHDTMIMEKGMQVRVGSSGKISYVPGDSGSILKQEIVYNTIVVPRGGEYKLELADGTLVWLNSDSELRYPVKFAGSQRDVWLKGEGYFEVSKNPEKPFRVVVDDMIVKVLGTSFNINAYKDRGNILTTLVSGKVDIQDMSGKSLVVMSPNQQVDFRHGKISVQEVDVTRFVSWIDGKFYFNDMTLENIMSQLQRWYDIEVFFVDEELKSYPFTGVIRRDFTAGQIFEIIEKTTRVKFNVRGKCVTVNHK